MRTWESWARVSARPPPAQWGQEPWVWQPFLLAGTMLGTGATSASKSARGLGPADQTQAASPSGTEGAPAPGGGWSLEGWPASPSLGWREPGASRGLRGPPPPEPCAVGRAVGSQPSPTLGEFCLLLQQKSFHLPWNQHGLKTKPPWSAPSHEDACPSGPAPRGAPFRGSRGRWLCQHPV